MNGRGSTTRSLGSHENDHHAHVNHWNIRWDDPSSEYNPTPNPDSFELYPIPSMGLAYIYLHLA